MARNDRSELIAKLSLGAIALGAAGLAYTSYIVDTAPTNGLELSRTYETALKIGLTSGIISAIGAILGISEAAGNNYRRGFR